MADDLNQLRRDVEEAIQPWTSKEALPPFRREHLVVMALIILDASSKAEDILLWIMNNFPHYTDHVLYDRAISSQRPVQWTNQQWGELLVMHSAHVWCLQLFNAPLTTGHSPCIYENSSTVPDFSRGSCLTRFRIASSASETRAFLQPVLGLGLTSKTQRIGFFDLAPEIREAIYDMLFVFPKSGLWYDRRQGASPPALAYDWFSIAPSSSNHLTAGPQAPRLHEGHDLFELRTQPVKDILAPLLISRQFYIEALPKFYSNNRFNCESVGSLGCFLESLSLSRRCHLRHVSFEHFEGCTSTRVTGASLRLFSQLKNLRTLEIFAEGEPSLQDLDYWKIVEDADNIKALQSITTLDTLTVHGCPRLEAALRSLIMTSSERLQAEATSKKRAVEEDGIDDEATAPKKKK